MLHIAQCTRCTTKSCSKQCITYANHTLASAILPTTNITILQTLLMFTVQFTQCSYQLWYWEWGDGPNQWSTKHSVTLQSTNATYVHDINPMTLFKHCIHQNVNENCFFINFLLDMLPRECPMTIKCFTLNVSTCQASFFLHYQPRHQIEWSKNNGQLPWLFDLSKCPENQFQITCLELIWNGIP